jgi:hypothetical protein
VSWYQTSAGQRYAAEHGLSTCDGCGMYECRCAEIAAQEQPEWDCEQCEDSRLVDCPTCGGESILDDDEPCPDCATGYVACPDCTG